MCDTQEMVNVLFSRVNVIINFFFGPQVQKYHSSGQCLRAERFFFFFFNTFIPIPDPIPEAHFNMCSHFNLCSSLYVLF